jgi:hypothetical protein
MERIERFEVEHFQFFGSRKDGFGKTDMIRCRAVQQQHPFTFITIGCFKYFVKENIAAEI